MIHDHRAIFDRFREDIARHAATPNMSPFWIEQSRNIAEDARVGSPFDFLRWPSLNSFSIPESWIPEAYYEELQASPEWQRRWWPLTRETKIGAPKDYARDFGTSPILIQHAYHLMRHERATAKSLLDCDVIFEIGGGYGSFCRLLNRSGFTGLHIIYDIPNVSSIQRLYLGLSGFAEVACTEVGRRASHAFCLATATDLDVVYNLLKAGSIKVGLVATWSLSETPNAVRATIFPRFHRFGSHYLIAYQPNWDAIDNAAYFDGVSRDRPDLTWHKEEMPRAIIPPSTYLFA